MNDAGSGFRFRGLSVRILTEPTATTLRLTSGYYALCLKPESCSLAASSLGYWDAEPVQISPEPDQYLEVDFALLKEGQNEALTAQLKARWNLISTPLVLDEDSASALFAQRATSMWCWCGYDYENVSILPPKKGAWVYRNELDAITLTGVRETDRALYLDKSWNLVGPVTRCPQPSSPAIDAHIWRWDASDQRYERVDAGEDLTPGQGYWIHATEACEIQLDEKYGGQGAE